MTKDENQNIGEKVELPQQLSLLQDITDQAVNSQSLRLWDSLVNAVFDDKKVVNRVAGKFLEVKKTAIEFEGSKVEIVRYPARKITGDSEKDVFPMKRDFKILEALIKLAVDDTSTAFYQGEGISLTVKASYYRVYQVFKRITGKASFSYQQIEDSIDTLSKAHTEFKFNGMEIKGALISSYVGKRGDDLSSSEFLITFHPIISRLVLMGGFRESNLKRTLSHKDMFTTFLYKKFVHNFKQAKGNNHYHFLLNNILKEVPNISQWKQKTKQIEKVIFSLEKLQGDVVSKWELERRYSTGGGQNRTIDCLFKVWFTDSFIKEQINANKKASKEVVLLPDGRVLKYPQVKDYTDKAQYMKDLELWHSDKKEPESVVQKIFKKD